MIKPQQMTDYFEITKGKWHYSTLKETIKKLEYVLDTYTGKKDVKLKKILKHKFYLVESLFYFTNMTHFERNIQNLELAIKIACEKAKEQKIDINAENPVELFMRLKNSKPLKEELIQEAFNFYKQYGVLTRSKLREKGYEGLYTKLYRFFKHKNTQKSICELCFYYFKRNGWITREEHKSNLSKD